jgi:hypothetical protein
MRTTSNRVLDSREFPYTNLSSPPPRDPNLVAKLKEIAQGFSQLQQDRHFADCNLTQSLDPGTALSQVKRAEKIFLLLPLIKNEQIIQEYLTLLLVKNRTE